MQQRTQLISTQVASAFLAALMLASAHHIAQAETPPELAKFAGNYVYSGTKDQGTAIIDKAIDDGLSDVNMVMRFMIKKYLDDHFVDAISIDVPSGKIGIKTGELPKATTDIGKSESFKSPDGKYTIKVTHQFDGSRITEISEGDNGTTTTVYTLASDGKTLNRNVTFKSDRLQKPVKYKLVYKRK